ncbi:MAG: amidohydrolase [Bacillota bacterium]
MTRESRAATPERAGQPPAAPPTERLVFHGGVIRTLAADRPVVEALGVIGDRIAAVGSRSEVEAALTTGDGRRPRPVDLRGGLLLPGFVDSHTHLGSFGLRLSLVDVDGARSLEDVCRRVAAFAADLPPGRWVRGGGWNKNAWPGGRFPTRHDLDRAAPRNPAALNSKDGHTWWVNTEGLRLLGIGRDTPDPPGGEIERDADGEPTGILKENAGMYLAKAVEQPSSEEYARCMTAAAAAANRRGLVGVHDMAGRESLRVYQALDRAGVLTLRVWMYLPDEMLPNLSAAGLEGGFGGACVRIAGIKAFLDGALGSQTADMLEPYEGSDRRGVTVMPPEVFRDLVARAAAARLPVAVHAIGDRANRSALDAFEASLDASRAAGLRHRIEHAQLFHPDDLPRVGRLGLVASVQPIHAPSDRDIADNYWGPRRCGHGAYAWRSLLQTGARLAFGSDVPVETLDPLQGLYAAVTRRHPEDPSREPWYPEESVSLEDAVRGYTVWSAWAVRAEGERGTLEEGKMADLVVLSEDILGRSDPEVLLRTEVVATLVGGRFVHGEL